MIQRTLALLIIVLILAGARPAQTGVWNPLAYAVVGQAGEWDKQHFTTIQAALDSGATRIIVRPGTYAESITINTEGVTIEAQGAIIPNDGTTCAVTIAAPYVTIKGDLLIQGSSNGTVGGYYAGGTGFCINASYAHLDGVKTSNLYSFAVLAHNTVDHITLERFEFTHICTAPTPRCYANPAIQFMGSSYNTVRNGLVRGHSGALHTWYGANHTQGHDNRFEQNYGFVGQDGNYVPRAIIENYGLDSGNIGNRFYNNVMDGSNGSGLEEADVTHETVFSGNTIRNVHSCFGVMGSADNKAHNITIESNTCYGNGTEQPSNWFSGSGWVRDNYFIDYIQNNIGTIYIPDNVHGDGVVITGNTFESNGRVTRLSGGNVTFQGNTITNPQYGNAIYIDSGVRDIWIKDNRFQSDGSLKVIDSNGASRLTITGNYIEGYLWLLSGTSDSVVSDNEIRSSAWLAIGVPTQSILQNNRVYTDGTPFLVVGGTQYSLLERNFYAMLDGSASSTPPDCGTLNTCSRNWTAGQAPPP